MAIVFFNALLIMQLQDLQKKIDGQDAPSYPSKVWHPIIIDYLKACYNGHYQHPCVGLYAMLTGINWNPTR